MGRDRHEAEKTGNEKPNNGLCGSATGGGAAVWRLQRHGVRAHTGADRGPTQAPTSVPTQAPTPKPTATPEPLSQEEQIVASVREDLRMLATEDREIALVAQEDAIYTFTLNGRYVGPNIMFVDGGFIFASGTDITDEMSFTYGVGFVCLLRAVLPEREMSFSDGYDAYQEWFLLPYSQTSSVVEKQIDGHDFAYGLHEDYGWMLIVSF